MKDETKTHREDTTETKPGLFKRIFTKMDDAMKAKADEAAKGSCCSGKDNKGDKFC